MSKNKNVNSKIYLINDFREKQNRVLNNESLKRYLEVLSMPDLISETKDLIKTINTGGIDRDVIDLSKQLLSEFTTRLNADSDGFTSKLKKIGKNVAEKTIRF